MRRLISCHNLTGIGKDSSGEQAKRIDTCVREKNSLRKGGSVRTVLTGDRKQQ